MPEERKDPPKSCSQDTRGLAKEAHGEVEVSREKNPVEEEARREHSSAETGRMRGREKKNLIQPL